MELDLELELELEPLLQLLIVADDPLVRSGLSAILGGSETFEIVGQTDLEGLSRAVDIHRPDILLWDIGDEWDAQLDELEDEGLPLIGLVPQRFEALGRLSRLAGLLQRGVEVKQVEVALAAIALGLHVIAPEFKTALPDDKTQLSLEIDIEPLTPREQEVLDLLADGLTNKGIGQALGISSHTIKFHVTSILNKLNAQSRTEAVTIATRAGLLSI